MRFIGNAGFDLKFISDLCSQPIIGCGVVKPGDAVKIDSPMVIDLNINIAKYFFWVWKIGGRAFPVII